MLHHQTPFDENDRPGIAIPPPTSSRGHQRSRTTVDLPLLHTRSSSVSPTRFSTFLPSLRSPSRTASPERVSVKEAAKFDVVAQEPAQRSRPGGGVRNLASWFEGTSDPVNISLIPSSNKEKIDPIQEPEKMEKLFSASNDSVDNLTRRPQTKPPASASASTPGSRFSFFRKASQLQTPIASDGEELATLDIRETLFPCGPPDEFSPAAMKNLQLNAEGTLRRFQASHIEQQKQVRSLTATKTSQADDLEACQTRNEHLKLQLVEMAEKAAEQDRLITALRSELASAQNRSSSETQDISIRKVSASSIRQPPFRRNRSSNISTLSADSDDSSVFSVFSVADSMDSPGTSIAASPVMKHANLHYTNVQHQSPTTHHHQHAAVIPVAECEKCHGVRANEAWDVVAMMKAESQALKVRISELEGANDEALSFLDGLRIS